MATLARITVSEAGLVGLQSKVDELNKRAARHGMNEVVVTVVNTETTTYPETGLEFFTYDIEIEGTTPRIDGWYLAAVIENNETIGKIVRVVPGKFEDHDYSCYRDHDFHCDHCNTTRRRNDVFVLKNDDGETKVVGRNCLADFVRTGDADSFARYAELCERISNMTCEGCEAHAREEGFGGRGSTPTVGLERFLQAVAVCTRRIGWTSRSEAYDNPDKFATANDAYFLLFGRGRAHEEFVKHYQLYVNDGDRDRAEKAIAWAKQVQSGKSEYLEIINKIAIAEQLDGKLAGYAASIIRAYQRDCERQEKAAGQPEKDYIGSVGGAQELGKVTVKRLHSIDGYYGVKTIIAMEAKLSDNRVAPITWFASGDKLDDYDEGATYTLRASVKEHKDDARYGKQTIVNRAKLVAV